MCEANVYMRDENGNEQIVLELVNRIIPSKDGIMLESIFSERKELRAFIKEMTLLEHKIILEKL